MSAFSLPPLAASTTEFSETGKRLKSGIGKVSLSDVIVVGNAIVCASDSSNDLQVLVPGKKPQALHLPGLPGHGKSDIEALAFDELTRRLYVSCEQPGKLLVYDLNLEEGKAKKLAEQKLPAEFRVALNKGIEGLAYLSSARAPDGAARLLAVKEGFPRRILVFNPTTLEVMQELKLPKAAKDVLADLSECEIDPRTGNLVIVSQESGRIFGLQLSANADGTLTLNADGEVRVLGTSQKKELKRRLESMTFTPTGELVLGFERNGKIQRFDQDGFDPPSP